MDTRTQGARGTRVGPDRATDSKGGQRRLTQRIVDALRPAAGERFVVWDSVVRGLGVRCYERSASYVLRYKPRGRAQVLATIGDARTMPLDDARREAERLRGADLVVPRGANVDKLLTHFETNHRTRKKGRAPTEDPDTRRRLALLRAKWGKRAADEITHVDVAAVLLEITTRGAPYEANRTRALVRAIWNEARRLALVPASMLNPAEGTPVNRERQRDVRALKPAELQRLLAAADRYANPWAGGAVTLLVHTGCRAGEVLALQWADVDLAQRAMLLRDRKGGDNLALPLNTDAVALLKSLPRQAGSPWVFPSSSTPRGHLVDLRKPWATILEGAELPATTRLHDVRAAVATNIAGTSGLKVAKLVLGHADERTTMRYVRNTGIEDLRAAVEAHGRAATGTTATPKRARRAGAK